VVVKLRRGNAAVIPSPYIPQVGMMQPGFVRNSQPYGCFVDFPHQLSGLAPLKYLSDQYVSRPSEVYQEMQTVWAKVRVTAVVVGVGEVCMSLLSDIVRDWSDKNILPVSKCYVEPWGLFSLLNAVCSLVRDEGEFS
jgi:hypothetical protein